MTRNTALTLQQRLENVGLATAHFELTRAATRHTAGICLSKARQPHHKRRGAGHKRLRLREHVEKRRQHLRAGV